VNISKEQAQNIAEEKVRQKDVAALRYLMADACGRWFFMRLLEQCHVLSPAMFSEENINRLLIAEGARRVGLIILHNVELMNALDEKQQAEREYSAFMRQVDELVKSAEKNNERGATHDPMDF
jgi:hypothetical protein